MNSRQQIAALLKRLLGEDVEQMLEVPPQPELGDYALPCFSFAKTLKRNPNDIAIDLSKKLKADIFEKVEAKGPYVNFFLNKKSLAKEILPRILKEKEKYGYSKQGKGKTIVLDMSSPNIAKPFGIGHLRSTIIGNALHHLLVAQGYKVVRVNHLGNWGTQFGKLITAYKRWGKKAELMKDPIKYLLNIYVKFHEEAEKDPLLEEQARVWFKKLEEGNKEAVQLWKTFRNLSLKEFKKIYKILKVDFESYEGEAFYNNKMDAVIKELEEKQLLEESEGAQIVNLEKQGLTSAIIKKKDGATLYITRDLAAALYRKKTYNADKLLYEVGSEQRLHFQQLFKILELMGYTWAKECVHITHGLYLDQDRKKLSTRKGKTVFMDEIITEAIDLAKKIIQEKNPKLKNKDKVAEAVGVGAIIFNDLSNDRNNDIIFDMDNFLSFEGETGPYIQYTHARIQSILGKYGKKVPTTIDYNCFSGEEKQILSLLGNYPGILEQAAKSFKPSILAQYLIKLSQEFNSFYAHSPILKAEQKTKEVRLVLISAVALVIRSGLSLLQIDAVAQM